MATPLERPPVSAPGYDRPTLADVLPAVAASLGADGFSARDTMVAEPAPARRSVVVLVDGLGENLLRRRGGHAPFLRSLLAGSTSLECGYPSTTATSMGTFGTGLPPGRHGLVGYEVLDPATGRVFNELSWDNGPDPFTWQPHATVFQRLEADGISTTRVGPGFFDGSGLTNAALRGGRFVAARDLAARVDAAVDAVRSSRRALVYLYWGDLDKVGHSSGVGTLEWGEHLELVDAELARLARSVPGDTSVHITGDHGMVDVPDERRVDLVDEPALLDGVRAVAGEPRSVQLHCADGRAAEVAARWRDRFAGEAEVSLREVAVDDGWFGTVDAHVLPRIGDVLVNPLTDLAVVDSARMRPELLRLRGLHGSVTSDETVVPFLSVPARAEP